MSIEDHYVQFKNVKKSYDQKLLVVKDFNLDIKKGEFVTLLGPSGSGKTTCLMMLAGFESVTSGEIIINGQPVNNIAPYHRNIGMVFQNYALFPHMSIAKNIAFPLEMRETPQNEIDRRVEDTLNLVGLGELGGRLPRELSGGQQQRVAVARALVFEPDILLMDEPLGALDKNMRQTMQFELKQLHQRIGVTVIYVTHDQEEALYLSDRVVVFNEGRVAQEAPPETLYNTPNSAFVANFLGECNLVPVTADGDGVSLLSGRTLNLSLKGEKGAVNMIGVRPERMTIGDAAKMCENQFDAVIEEVFFLGQGYKVIAKAEGVNWTIVSQNRLSMTKLTVGEQIPIGFDVDDAILFRD